MPRLASSSRSRTAVGVRPRVVAHQTPRPDPVTLEEVERALDEADDSRRPLVSVQLRVRQTRVILDERVHELGADAHALFGARPVADAGDGGAGTEEAAEALGIDVQEVARTGPLVAPRRLARGARKP